MENNILVMAFLLVALLASFVPSAGGDDQII